MVKEDPPESGPFGLPPDKRGKRPDPSKGKPADPPAKPGKEK